MCEENNQWEWREREVTELVQTSRHDKYNDCPSEPDFHKSNEAYVVEDSGNLINVIR